MEFFAGSLFYIWSVILLSELCPEIPCVTWGHDSSLPLEHNGWLIFLFHSWLELLSLECVRDGTHHSQLLYESTMWNYVIPVSVLINFKFQWFPFYCLTFAWGFVVWVSSNFLLWSLILYVFSFSWTLQYFW